MEKVRKPKRISEKDTNFILSLSSDDIDMKLLKDFFAFKFKNPARFNPDDTFTLPKDKCYNSERIVTTVGEYIFNLFTLFPKVIQLVGYQNIVMDGDALNGLEQEMSNYLVEDKITVEEFVEYLDKLQWLGFGISRFMNASLTSEFLELPKSTQDLKDDLVKKNEKVIKSGDIIAFDKMEKEIISHAKNEVKDTPAYQIYASGGRGSFGNNYKNTSIFRGAIKNLGDENQVHISTSSLVDGIPPEELEFYGDLITQASYQRAVGTQEGGLTLIQAHLVKLNSFNCWDNLIAG